MNPKQQIIDALRQDSQRMQILSTARRLGLHDWCLGAGFIRNLVWDKRHDYRVATPLNDIDVIHFDPRNSDAQHDAILETRLLEWLTQPWSVKNQARMHLRSNRSPYLNSEDAISYWPEIETAVGARLNADDSITLIAPFGLQALFNDTITFNAKSNNFTAFEQRIRQKRWLQRWPRLKVVNTLSG
ncbi:nitrate reductase [Chania multitudinisentens RB-25]|uniref:Nitrate reductase n=1 Tax=Chania multitudinisentens RB-25 TaxID=1441930 RepID=W0L9G9_9GAMM|nr:nucleotidyltransferase family protein [Chania multitudinisentens]AHG18902.1 nitrate reductase [Chania multitudinisentens RB-25]